MKIVLSQSPQQRVTLLSSAADLQPQLSFNLLCKCNPTHLGFFQVYISSSVAYPELVSRGVSKSRKFKWLVKVGACKDVNPLILKKIMAGGGFRATRKPPWIRHWSYLFIILQIDPSHIARNNYVQARPGPQNNFIFEAQAQPELAGPGPGHRPDHIRPTKQQNYYCVHILM